MRRLHFVAAVGMLVLGSRAACKPEPHHEGLVRTTSASTAGAVHSDLDRFIRRREICEHYRGEDPYDSARRVFLDQEFTKFCRGTDRELAALRRKYRNDPRIIRRLWRYDDQVE